MDAKLAKVSKQEKLLQSLQRSRTARKLKESFDEEKFFGRNPKKFLLQGQKNSTLPRAQDGTVMSLENWNSDKFAQFLEGLTVKQEEDLADQLLLAHQAKQPATGGKGCCCPECVIVAEDKTIMTVYNFTCGKFDEYLDSLSPAEEERLADHLVAQNERQEELYAATAFRCKGISEDGKPAPADSVSCPIETALDLMWNLTI